MKRLFPLFAIIILLLSEKSLQAQLPQKQYLLTLPQGHLLEGLYGGSSLASVKSPLSNINAGNPAALSKRNGFSVGLSFELSSDISDSWVANIGYKRNHILYPQAIALSYRFDNFSVGIGSSQIYNGTIDYGKFSGTIRSDNDQGYIVIGSVHPVRKDIVIKNALIINYNLKQLLNLSGDLSLGFAYSYNYLRSIHNVKLVTDDPDIWGNFDQDWDMDIYEPGFAVGITYGFNTSHFRFLQWGIYYESEIPFYKQDLVAGNNLIFTANFPEKIHTGIAIGFQNNFSVTSDLSWYLWEFANRFDSRNQIQVAVRLSYLFDKSLMPSIGVIISDWHYNIEDDVFNLNNSLFATFLTGGVVYAYEHYEFDLSVADSHLFSDDWRMQTIVRIGLGYSF